MKKTTQVTAKAIPQTQSGLAAHADSIGIVGAVFAGVLLLFASGFAQATVMHDTAHDQRHAMAFPCH